MDLFKKISKIVYGEERELNKSTKPRFLIVFNKTEGLKLLINLHQPFKYYSLIFGNLYKFGKESMVNNSNEVNQLAGEIFLSFLYEEKIINEDLIRKVEEFCSKNEYDIKVINRIKTFYFSKDIDSINENIDKKTTKLKEKTGEMKIVLQNEAKQNPDGDFYAHIYFRNSLSENSEIILDKKSKININNNQFRDILSLVSENLTQIIKDDVNEGKINKIIENLRELSTSDLNLYNDKLKEIEKNNNSKKLESFKRILSFLSKLKKGTPARIYMPELINDHYNDLKNLLSDNDFDYVKNEAYKQKEERLLNLILNENPWMLGYSDNEKVVNFKDALKQERERWKPDLVIKRNDGSLDIYELKLSSESLYGWDSSHKSHYAKGPLSKAVSQIESQHQSLLLNGNKQITKNDTLNIIIGNYQNEIGEITQKEEEFSGSREEAKEYKIENIKLLRNKYKNAKIIFFDETNFNFK